MLWRILSWLLGSVDKSIGLVRWMLPQRARPKFFADGWGKYELAFGAQDEMLSMLKSSDKRNRFRTELENGSIQWSQPVVKSSISVTSGAFPSPVAHLLPDKAKLCRFYYVQPIIEEKRKTVTIIMLPGTGEAGKGDRLKMATQLADECGWSSIIVTAPYYAARKPDNQTAFFVRTVEDLLLQSVAIMQEAAILASYFLHRSEQQRVCITGFSWGAAMASGAAAVALTTAHKDAGRRLACVPYVGCSSPSILVSGVLESSIDWTALQQKPNEPHGETHAQALEVLGRFHLSPLNDAVQSQNKSIAALHIVNMQHDYFIPQRFSREFTAELGRMTSDTSNRAAQVLPGGHVVAMLVRPWYQKRAIVDAVHALF